MPTLLLVRHGQASFGAEDYDVLSPLGIEQSRVVGEHLARRYPGLDAVYRGPLRRQRDTADGLIAGARAAGRELPPAVELAGFDEYPAIELIRRWIPRLRQSDPEMAERLGDPRRMQEVFESMIERWVGGELVEDADLESFAGFAARVDAALDAVMSEVDGGRTVAVVTSGGPIGMALRRCLGLGDAMALRAAWVVANGSYSELRFRAAGGGTRRLTLVGFNHAVHFDGRLTTYR